MYKISACPSPYFYNVGSGPPCSQHRLHGEGRGRRPARSSAPQCLPGDIRRGDAAVDSVRHEIVRDVPLNFGPSCSLQARTARSTQGECLHVDRCHDAAGAIILHVSAAGNRPKTGRPTYPAAQIAEQKALAKQRMSELKAGKPRTASHSTPRTGWLTSRPKIAQPSAAASCRILEWPAPE